MRFACLIPCYNESQRLDVDLYRQIVLNNPLIDFYLLNDGSSDNTIDVLKRVSEGNDNVVVKDFRPNRGKAGVIQSGMMELSDSKYDYVGFLDADFATPFEEFKRLTEIVENEGYDVIFGSRVKLKGWQIVRNPIRHWFSRIILTVIDTLFKLEIYDTQCGCKIFKREIITVCFKENFVTKWLFDIEVFIRYLRKTSAPNIKEIPLYRWKEIKGSKLKIGDFLQVPLNILQLYSRYGRS